MVLIFYIENNVFVEICKHRLRNKVKMSLWKPSLRLNKNQTKTGNWKPQLKGLPTSQILTRRLKIVL